MVMLRLRYLDETLSLEQRISFAKQGDIIVFSVKPFSLSVLVGCSVVRSE